MFIAEYRTPSSKIQEPDIISQAESFSLEENIENQLNK